MDFNRLLSLIATSIGALGSVYLLKSLLMLTPALTARHATSAWGFDLFQIDSLSEQRAESLVGAGAILLAFVLGFLSLADVTAAGAFESKASGIVAALSSTAAVGVVMHFAWRALSRRHNRASRRALLRERLEAVVAEGRFSKAFLDDISASARLLIGLDVDPAVGPRALFTRVANAIGHPLSAVAAIPVETPEQ